MNKQDLVQFTFTGESFNPDAFKGGVIVNGTRYTPAPDTHGHASVEDWLASKGVEIEYCNDPDGWFVYVPPQGAGTAQSINSDPYPTYLAARDAAVAWVKQQEDSDAS